MTTHNVTSAPKRTWGNPTKYKPEYCELLIEHMSEGYSFEAFAGLLKVDRKTLYNWLTLFPEFREAKEIADQQSRLWAERQLRVHIEGGVRANPIPLLFYMKNRFPNEWRDRKEIELQKNDANENKSLTLDEQLAKLEAMRTHLLSLIASQTQSEAMTIDASAEVKTE